LIDAGAQIAARSRFYSQTVTGEQTQRAGREELNYTMLKGGSTPLLFAARSGDAESVRHLLAAGADPNDAFPNGMTALITAAYSGHERAAIFLIEHGADVNNDAIGYTALHAAVLKSELDVVKSLLAHGANPNATTTKGTPIRRNTTDFNLPATLIGATPYLLAAKFAEPEIMRALAAGGADSTIAMKDGTTAIMLAAGIGFASGANRRGIAILDGGKVDDEAQVIASVKAAIDLGADVRMANQAGDTALHGAASIGCDEAVRLLVAKGAEINAKNKRGFTPLAIARGAGQRRGAAAAAAGADQSDGPAERRSTIDLLHKLGAAE
jgi:ankyrin repeat protein